MIASALPLLFVVSIGICADLNTFDGYVNYYKNLVLRGSQEAIGYRWPRNASQYEGDESITFGESSVFVCYAGRRVKIFENWL